MGGSDSKEKKKGEPQKEQQHSTKKSAISSSDRVKLQLKIQRDNLRAAINKYENVSTVEREKAKQFLQAGDRRKALYCIKREKIQEGRILQLEGMYDNIEKLLDTIEVKEVEMQIFESLKEGNKELKKLNSILNIDDIEKLLDETEESIEDARQINDVLAQPIDGSYIDDDELLSELVGSQEELSHVNDISKIKIPDTVPNAPTKTTKNYQAEEGLVAA